jgi:hypothetical protein
MYYAIKLSDGSYLKGHGRAGYPVLYNSYNTALRYARERIPAHVCLSLYTIVPVVISEGGAS